MGLGRITDKASLRFDAPEGGVPGGAKPLNVGFVTRQANTRIALVMKNGPSTARVTRLGVIVWFFWVGPAHAVQ